jgi:predicted ATPase/DNA-binding CsgD family transcriptional regulator/uncharacterized protein HemY
MPGTEIEMPNAFAAMLPVQPTPFIGREKEVDLACALLRREGMRLVTFTGPGGTGKTRMGIEVASRLPGEFSDGVYFVPLAAITDPSLVATSISQVLGVKEAGNRLLIDSLKAHLRDKRMMLVLDNFEQVLDAAPLVSEVLAEAPGLKILATSRERLHVRGEHEYPVPPLTMPPDPAHLPSLERLTQYEALRMFIDRAVALRPDFAVDNANAPAVAEICARLDGLPLAIELAAARIKILSPEAILARLQHRLKLLTGGEKDLPARHRTLRAAIGWSYDLLDEAEKTLFRRLSVFAGSRSFEAIEAVCGGSDDDVLEGVSSLVDKNLLRQVGGRDTRRVPGFVMLETIQEYAREKLVESGEVEVLQQRHAQFFLALAENAEPELRGAKQVEWVERLEAEHDNLRSALKWAIEQGANDIALRLGSALMQFWRMHGHLSEGRAWLEGALAASAATAQGAPAPARAEALMAAGTLASVQADYTRARAALEQSLELFRQLDDKENIAATLRNLGNEVRYQGDLERSYALFEEGLAISRELGNRWDIAAFLGDLGIAAQALGDQESARSLYAESLALRRELKDKRGIAMMLVNIGELARTEGDYDSARSLYEEGLVIARELGDKWGVGMVLHNLGHVAYHRHQYEQALELFTESLTIFYEMRNKRDIAYCLAALAGVFGAQRQPERAAMLFSAAQALSNTISSHLDPADLLEYERNVDLVQSQISLEAWKRAWDKGQSMTLDEAVACALERTYETRQTIRPSLTTTPLGEYPAGLTEREVEVLRLVATGMPDIEVAEELSISPRTVHRHLSSIYSKLGVSTRTAAARVASELGLA